MARKKFQSIKIQIAKNLDYKEHCQGLLSGDVFRTIICPMDKRSTPTKDGKKTLYDMTWIEYDNKKIWLEEHEYNKIGD